MPSKRTWLWIGAGAGLVALVAAGRSRFSAARYVPGSAAAVALFRAAASAAGLPASWASSASLHAILASESGGWVGRPNYTFGAASSAENRGAWSAIWTRLRAGEIWTASTATGLGQLLTANVKAFYPGGLTGIGRALPEAVGMLRYIASRYGSPEVAKAAYGKPGSYVHAMTGKTMNKGFQEGY